jgi:hypothetical protein
MQVAIRNTSVADPGCLSQISDLIKTKRGGKIIYCLTFFVAINFTKLKNYPYLINLFQEVQNLSYPKLL